VTDAHELIAEAEREELLTLKEFAHLFDRSLDGLRRSVTRGSLKEARKIANQWYVLVPSRIVRAMRNKSQ
jgi:hypothetical protein